MKFSGPGAFFSRWPLPRFSVQLRPPDLARWRAGSHGIPGVIRLEGARPGPDVAVVALTHGNEIGGAVLFARLLAGGIPLRRGTLSLVFANLAAYDRFAAHNPTASRYVEEDLNRLWSPARLDGPEHSLELDRARALRPVVESADVLLDLHSMFWPAEPLILCGASARGRTLAASLGCPSLVVADRGHSAGPRLIDHPRFLDPTGTATAILVEAGQHWAGETVATMAAAMGQLLRALDMIGEHPLLPPPPPDGPVRVAEVVETILAATDGFTFAQPWAGGTVIPRQGTLIARDGTREIHTPCDDCLLVMPSLRAGRGQTAVRLARFVPVAGKAASTSFS